MGAVTIDFWYLTEFESWEKQAAESLDDRQGDYRDIGQKVSQISTPRGNLDQCNYYLRAKEKKLQEKVECLDNFKQTVVSFVKDAKSADKRVADRVGTETEHFCKNNGIALATSGVGAWIGEKLSNLWNATKSFFNDAVIVIGSVVETVKKLYEENKYWIDAVVDVVLFVGAAVGVAAAIASGAGILALGAALFGLYNSTADAAGSLLAAGSYYGAGDHDAAERWSKFDGREAFRATGEMLDDLTGREFFETGATVLYSGLSIAAAVYSIGNAGKDILKQFDFKNQGVRALTEKKAWKGAAKTFFGIEERTSRADESGMEKITEMSSMFNISEAAAERVLQLGNYIGNTKTIMETVDNVITSSYQTGNEQICTLLKSTVFGDDVSTIVDNVEKIIEAI